MFVTTKGPNNTHILLGLLLSWGILNKSGSSRTLLSKFTGLLTFEIHCSSIETLLKALTAERNGDVICLLLHTLTLENLLANFQQIALSLRQYNIGKKLLTFQGAVYPEKS